MKNFILAVSLLFATAFFVTSCGSSSPSEEKKEEPVVSAKEEPKPEPEKKMVVITTTPKKVFAGDYQFVKDTGTADGVKYTEEISSFTLMVGWEDSTILMPVTVKVSNWWKNNEQNPGYTEELKKLLSEVKKLKPENFIVTLVNGQISNVSIKPVYKEAGNGSVGELIYPERVLYPWVYFDHSETGG